MQKLIFLSLLMSFTAITSVYAENKNGEKIFNSKSCSLCHKKDVEAVGPSLISIAKAYSAKQKELVSYLRSTAAPIIAPERASVMNPQLAKIKTLSKKDMEDLAVYILSASDRPN